MKNKVLMTSILALCIATPALAEGEIANANGLLLDKSCNEDTLNVTEGIANIEAIWIPKTYSISYTCADGTIVRPATEMTMVDCDADPTNDECINSGYAVYGKYFSFAKRSCRGGGYYQTSWSCTRDTVENDTPIIYQPEEIIIWDIPYNLTCTAVEVGNTIKLDWYDRGVKQTVSSSVAECRYGDTAQNSKPLTLPSAPAPRDGYTFSGWKVFDICPSFETQSTCNGNASCFWHIDSNTNVGSCVNMYNNDCESANGNRNACNGIGYCRYNKMGGSCLIDTDTLCSSMSETECLLHYNSETDTGCHWMTNIPQQIQQNVALINGSSACVGDALRIRIESALANTL